MHKHDKFRWVYASLALWLIVSPFLLLGGERSLMNARIKRPLMPPTHALNRASVIFPHYRGARWCLRQLLVFRQPLSIQSLNASSGKALPYMNLARQASLRVSNACSGIFLIFRKYNLFDFRPLSSPKSTS